MLAFQFDGKYYLDVCPSFGARLSGSTCQRTTNAVVHLLRKKDMWTLAYLDDLCGAESTKQAAQVSYDAIQQLAARLGLQLAPDKCEPPTQQVPDP